MSGNEEQGIYTPISGKPESREVESEDKGPLSWFLLQAENTYSRLVPVGTPPPRAMMKRGGLPSFESQYEPGIGEDILLHPPKSVWKERLAQFRKRKAEAVLRKRARGTGTIAPGAPIIPGERNWRPLGPNIVLDGQTVGDNPVGGRVVGVAIGADGDVIYAATAAGGVFRSDNAGANWRSLMDDFDVDPTDFASASLACGAIAIDPNDINRVYVGTGEGDTHAIFSQRVVNALPAYRGIGPIRSDDGGLSWVMEESADGSPDLAGDAFFRLAVDPRDRENVVAATTLGIYQRVPANSGNHEWVQRRTNICSSVVVARNGDTTRFFAAEWGGDVFQSEDGENWTTAGTGFPTTGMGRIALAVLFDRPELIYAFVANNNGGVGGIFRLDSIGGTWKEVRNVPNVLPGEQGSYDLDIAIDPNDENLLYLAGDHMGTYPWAGSVWRTRVEPEGTNFRCSNSASIGTHAHADVHVLVHSPGNSNELWCGTDGGLFLNRNPRGNGEFGSRNQGLSCLCCNFIAQHPTDPNILFSGLQDNGTAMTESPPIWTGVAFGDGGYCLMNWADPLKVLIFQNGWARRSTTGGASDEAWSTNWEFQWATMTQPIVGAPYNPSNPSEGDIVAFAAGTLVFISEDFAESQPNQSFDIPSASGRIFSLAFASPNRLFVGTTRGRVFRADRDNTLGWVLTRLDDVTPGRLPLTGLVSDVAVDWSDTDLESIYISFSGMGDHRRVWHFNGTIWEDRSGSPGATDLLDVEHNALVVDPQAPNNVYVGADIGVWHSADSGLNWNPFQNGLPDAPVFDLQIHPTQRLLRAATHGRGVYEIKLD